MKKIISFFVILSILISTLLPTFTFAKEQEKSSSQTEQIIVLQNVEKKETIFSRAVNKFKNLFFKVSWTMFYYALVTFSLINLFNRLGVCDKTKVYDDLKNKKYSDFLSSIWSNVKSTPECLKLIYYKMLKSEKIENARILKEQFNAVLSCEDMNLIDINEQIKDICSKANKNSFEELACNVVNSIDTMNNTEETNSKKLSNFLRNLSKPAQSTTNAWDYLRTHGTLLWLSSSFGSLIGKLGLAMGTFKLGWLYGLIMIPYLWSFKDEKVGELEILANGLDITEDSWQKLAQKSNNFNNALKSLWQNIAQKFSCNISESSAQNTADDLTKENSYNESSSQDLSDNSTNLM